MASREQKSEVIDFIKGNFDKATSVVLLNFAGIDVPMITDLRARGRSAGVEYKVVQNNLVRHALKGTPLESNAKLDASLRGMTGVAWSFEDPSAAAKIVKAFRKENEKQEKLAVKGGILDQSYLSPEQVENQLSSLPGKDELRASLLAQLMAPAQSLVRQLMAPMQNLVYALDARKRQLEESNG
jgi:large subunit ribosomal protein L10